MAFVPLAPVPNIETPMPFEAAAVYQAMGALYVPLASRYTAARPRGWKIPREADWPRKGRRIVASAPPCGNVAVLTGGAFDVIDFDGDGDAEAFARAAGIGEGVAGIAARFHTVRTARGLHLYTRATGLRTVAGLKVRTEGGEAFACDVRAAGGCAVAAGSINPISWHEYRFIGPRAALCARPLCALPSPILDAMREAQAGTMGDALPAGTMGDALPAAAPMGDAMERRIRRWVEGGRWLERLRYAGPGERNQALAAVSLNAFAHAVPYPDLIEAIWSACFDAARAAGLSKGEICGTLKKQIQYARLRHPCGQPLPERPLIR